MAHFAEIDADGTVTRVIVVDNSVLGADEREELGIDLLESLTGHRNWVQTSYSGKMRGGYATVGCKYDKALDVFISAEGD